MRLLVLFVAVLGIVAGLSLWLLPALAAASGTSISGGSLPRAITLSPLDEQALFQRINTPPRLVEQPVTAGQNYTLTSPYWDSLLRAAKDTPAAAAATYFPDGGFVRATQGGADAWLVLDLRQRAIVDRYIRLGENSAIQVANPGALDVLQAAAANGEEIGIQVGNQPLAANQRSAFWSASSGLTIVSGARTAPPVTDNGIWLTFNLVEGRSIELHYSPADRTLADAAGLERYAVPAALDRYIATLDAAAAEPVAQDAGRGAPFWWPLGIAIGAGLLTSAFWLQRRLG